MEHPVNPDLRTEPIDCGGRNIGNCSGQAVAPYGQNPASISETLAYRR